MDDIYTGTRISPRPPGRDPIQPYSRRERSSRRDRRIGELPELGLQRRECLRPGFAVVCVNVDPDHAIREPEPEVPVRVLPSPSSELVIVGTGCASPGEACRWRMLLPSR
jgi:hypothetical protein